MSTGDSTLSVSVGAIASAGIAAAFRHNLFPQHAFDGLLKLAVLGGVDERVDAAVGEHQHDAEVVQPPGVVDDVVDRVHEEEDLGHCPACDESAANHQRRHHRIASGCT